MSSVYISPEIVGNIVGVDVEKSDISSNKIKSISVVVEARNNQPCKGTFLCYNSIKKISKEEYKSLSVILDNGVERYISSKFTTNNITIRSYYNDSISIANEIALYCLLFDNSITIRCSSFILNDVLFVVCGQSNQGKSTLLKKILEKYENATPLSDDHITLKATNRISMCITPFWDEIYKVNKVKTYFTDVCIITLDNIISSEPSFLDLLPHVIGFNFNEISTTTLIPLAINFCQKSHIIKGTPRDYENNIRLIEKEIIAFSNDIHLRDKIEINGLVMLNYYGESMLPTIPKSTNILVKKINKLNIDSIYIVEDDTSPVKGYFCHRLISINGSYNFKGDNSTKIQKIDDPNKIIGEVDTWNLC